MRRCSAGFIQKRGVGPAECALSKDRTQGYSFTPHMNKVFPGWSFGHYNWYRRTAQPNSESRQGARVDSLVRFVRPGDTVCARFQFLAEMSGKLNEDQGDNHQREESSEFVGAHN